MNSCAISRDAYLNQSNVMGLMIVKMERMNTAVKVRLFFSFIFFLNFLIFFSDPHSRSHKSSFFLLLGIRNTHKKYSPAHYGNMVMTELFRPIFVFVSYLAKPEAINHYSNKALFFFLLYRL